MAPRSSKATKSDAPVAAREQLDAQEADANATDNLEEQAKEQEKLQAEQLKAGQGVGEDKTDLTPAQQRGNERVGTVAGFVDQMSRRSGSDALEGHFVTIDQNFDGVKEAYVQAGLADEDGNPIAGDYGVYIEPADLDETGFPVSGVVRLRDDTNARVVVPYDAMNPAAAGGRR